jgi:selenocysteine-specific elongation factor
MTIGVAGHVDHGKTTLVKQLTGIDTDRMKEEKLRGVSIEAGIAPWINGDGLSLSVVDVPGHTDFLKNTVRGLSAVDLAMLVVAADDGVMPQTLEHLETLRYFGANGGVVVLTKADLADEETLEIAELEIMEIVRGTFLEGKQVIAYSSIDGRNAEAIRAAVISEAAGAACKKADGPFRFWVDQCRHVNGFGTVVSGTVISGTIQKDDPVEILPHSRITRARFLESHGMRVEKAVAGQRIGMNLRNVPVGESERGSLIARPGTIRPSFLVNAEIEVRAMQKTVLSDRMKVKVYTGTFTASAVLVTMNGDSIAPGGRGCVQLRFSRPAPVLPGDRLVLSLMNVNTVVGGGRVIELPLEKLTRSRYGRLEPVLTSLVKKDVAAYVAFALQGGPASPVTVSALAGRSGFDRPSLENEFKKWVDRGEAVEYGDKGVFLKSRFLGITENVLTVAKRVFQEGNLKSKISFSEILSALETPVSEDVLKDVLDRLCGEGTLVREGGGFKLPDHRPVLSGPDAALSKRLLDYAARAGFVPFSVNQFCTETLEKWNPDKTLKILNFLHGQEKVVRLPNLRFLSISSMETIKDTVSRCISENGTMTISMSRDLLGFSRSIAIPVFEYLDSVGFTRREGEGRVLSGRD